MKKNLQTIYYKVLKLKNRIFSGRPVLVLMYHRVSDVSDKKTAHLTVSPANFEKQLLYFKQKFQILQLKEDWLSLKKTGLVITFDDGYADNYTNALPLLEKHQIPATIFVTTLNINTPKEFWWDRLAYDYDVMDDVFYVPENSNKLTKEKFTYGHCVDLVQKLNNTQKEQWLLAFETLNGIQFNHREEYRSFSKEELKELSVNSLIDIGLHSHNHYSLGNLSDEDQIQELALSIKKMNELVPFHLKHLALPHGSYNKTTLKVIKDLGILSVLLANNYYSDYKNKSEGKINRILMPNIGDQKLKKYLDYFDF